MLSTRRSSLVYLVALWVALLAGLGCSRPEQGLIVNVQTDYIPVAEFDTVRVRLDDADVRNVLVRTGDRIARPMFVTTYNEAAPGPRRVSVSLMRGNLELSRRNVEVQFRGTYLVTVVLTRSCAGLSCGVSQSCLGTRCVPVTCITGFEDDCPAPDCVSNASCASTTPCVVGECIAGACFQRPNDALCTASQICLPQTGCITRPIAPDANMSEDAGSMDYDGGTCGGPADCADAFACTIDTCTGGVCGHELSDVACPASACVPTDPMADPATGCLPACTTTTCVAAPCENASCAAGRCERTPRCASGESCCAGSCALDCGAAPCAGQPAGTSCRAAQGPCDVTETCDGTTSECPADALAPASSTCRAATGPCDAAERCTTGTADCATDSFVATGVACPSGSCDGLGACSSACSPGAACSTGNPCELGEFACGPTRCLAVGPAPAATICRAPAGPCDAQEICGGASTCPADGFSFSGICRDARGPCDIVESCFGSSAACPVDALYSGTVCRDAAGVCDAAETCSGASPRCPGDGFLIGTVCAGPTGPCDLGAECGAGPNCPASTPALDGSFCDERCGEEQCSAGVCVGGFTCRMGCNCDSVCLPFACL